ncbi:hypothetical protein ACJ41O_000326 [Fusarium nematophilum]
MADQLPLAAPEGMTIRRATREDLDVLVNLGLAAMAMDPQWDYRYPHRHDAFFYDDPNGQWAVYLVDCRQTPDSKPTTISFCVWDFPLGDGPDGESKPPAPPECLLNETRRDWILWRLNVPQEATWSASKDKFDAYGQKILLLHLLCTHPDYQRIGAASVLIRQGIRMAEDRDLVVTLFASPLRRLLCRRLGFADRGAVTAQVDGEEQSVTFEAVAWEPTGR